MRHGHAGLLLAVALVAGCAAAVPHQVAAVGATVPLSPLSDRRVASGWIPSWDLSDGLVSVEHHPDVFSDVSLFWYSATANSDVVRTDPGQPADSELVDAVQRLHAVGVRALPTIDDHGMTSTSMGKLLADPTRRHQLVDAVMAMVSSVGADGADIDFENMNFPASPWRATIEQKFPVFIDELQRALHAQGLLLSLTVPARLSDHDPNWSIYDYRALAKHSDRVRILTYDYHYAGGDPGPWAPVGWVNHVADYAKARFGRTPVWLGQPTGGLNWYVKRKSGHCPSMDPPITDTAVPTVAQARALAKQYGAKIHWDQSSGEYHFRYDRPYSSGGQSCVVLREVWFEDSRSVKAKLDVVKRQHVQGLATWTVGIEDPRTWRVFTDFAQSQVPGAAHAFVQVPQHVDFGDSWAIEGRFEVAGQPVVAEPVQVQRRVGDGPWQTVASVTSSSVGRVSYSTAATRTYDWRLRLAGGWDWSTTVTAPANVVVSRVVDVSLVQPAVASGDPFVINGTLSPTQSGVQVILERQVAGRWVPESTRHSKANGTFTFRGTAGSPGTTQYRVAASGDHQYGSGNSTVLVLTVS